MMSVANYALSANNKTLTITSGTQGVGVFSKQ
jgi:hypothetical protein